jgi:hypothetical protein
MRYALLFGLFLTIIQPLRPCSCASPPYESLCAVIESARSDQENIVVVRITSLTDREAEMTIERELTGVAPFREFTFLRGDGGNCGLPLSGAKVGDRFLGHFAFTTERSEYSGITCGYRYKVWPIRDGAVEYPNDWREAAPDGGPWRIYFDLNTLFASGDCLRFAGDNGIRNGLSIWPNPTPGTLRLDTLQAIPVVYRLELFDITGRPLESWSGPLSFPYEVDLAALPAGVYFLRVFADRQREVFRIVKT